MTVDDRLPSLAALREGLEWRAPEPGSATRVEARVKHLGGTGRAVAVAAADGRLLLRIDAALPEVFWAGSSEGQATDWTGMPRPLEGNDLEVARLTSAILTGTWLDDSAVVEVGSARNGSSISVHVRGGRLEARILHGPAEPLRPEAFEVETMSGTERFELTWGDPTFPWIPTRVRQALDGPPHTEYERVAAAVGESSAIGLSAPDFPLPDDFSFSDGVAAAVRAERAATGHILVETEIDGTRGWFILDTGASVTVVAAGWRSDLPILGESPLVSAYGVTAAPVRRVRTLSVGPLTLRGLPVVEMDLAFLAEPFGRPVQGIVGYDALSRCVATIESAVPRVELFAIPPASASPWSPFDFETKLPIVSGRFDGDGGRAGRFRIDLGAGPAVIFNWPTVERLNLLAGRTGQRVPAGVESMLMDSINWLEIAGQRVPDVVALFTEKPTCPVFHDRSTDGNVGLGFLDLFRLTIDYRRTRLALERR